MSRISWKLSVRDMLAVRGNYFTIDRRGSCWAITVHSAGNAPHVVTAASPGEVNRTRMSLSDAGFVGYVRKGADLG